MCLHVMDYPHPKYNQKWQLLLSDQWVIQPPDPSSEYVQCPACFPLSLTQFVQKSEQIIVLLVLWGTLPGKKNKGQMKWGKEIGEENFKTYISCEGWEALVWRMLGFSFNLKNLLKRLEISTT